MVSEGLGSKGGNVNISNFQTISTTTAIAEGSIIELDSSGNAQACATSQGVKTIGVAVTGKPATTAAEQRQIAVQTNGVVTLYGWKDSTSGFQTSIVPGERLIVGQDSDTSYTGQVVVHATASVTTTCDFNTDFRKPIGIALEAMSTAGTRTAIKVLLTL